MINLTKYNKQKLNNLIKKHGKGRFPLFPYLPINYYKIGTLVKVLSIIEEIDKKYCVVINKFSCHIYMVDNLSYTPISSAYISLSNNEYKKAMIIDAILKFLYYLDEIGQEEIRIKKAKEWIIDKLSTPVDIKIDDYYTIFRYNGQWIFSITHHSEFRGISASRDLILRPVQEKFGITVHIAGLLFFESVKELFKLDRDYGVTFIKEL